MENKIINVEKRTDNLFILFISVSDNDVFTKIVTLDEIKQLYNDIGALINI